MRLKQLAESIGARLVNAEHGDIEIESVSPLNDTRPGTISFMASTAYESLLSQFKASALIVKEPLADSKLPQLVHDNPHYAFAKAAGIFLKPSHPFDGVSDKAFIHPEAKLGERVRIGPFAYVGPRATLSDDAVLYPGVYLGESASVGKETVLYANVVVGDRCQVGERVIIHSNTVLGADGFGFAKGKDDIVKVPQVGIVVIEDEVEIGACATIDRATMGETRIGFGTKLDSKVHVAHNVRIGQHCMFSALTGVAGSTKIGDWVIAGGHAGFSGHITVGDHVTVGAKTGVITDVESGGVYMGFPAQPAQQWRRYQVYKKRLPDYDKRIKQLESRLQQLENPSI
jgi:UDP-3-O-[3-hydroxymyristoyl] glucosamine N-acyltransferase